MPYTRPAELVQIRSEYANFAPAQSDWVMGYDAEEIVRGTRALASLGTSANATSISPAIPPPRLKLSTACGFPPASFRLSGSPRCSAGIFCPKKTSPAATM